MKGLKFKLILIFGIFFLFSLTFSQDLISEKEKLEARLKELEAEVEKLQKEIISIGSQKKTLSNQISILNRKIKALELEIQRTNLLIESLNKQISNTIESIEVKEKEIGQTKEKLRAIFRRLEKEEQKSFFEVLLMEGSLSGFFENHFRLKLLGQEKDENLRKLVQLNESLKKTKLVLEDEKDDMENLLKIKELQKIDSEKTKREKDELLKITKGKEAEYQKLLKEKQKEAERIRQRLFELVGVPQAPTFGQAYEIAKFVSSITGVRPAFLLAVLKQESNLGKNVGQCYLTDLATGRGKKISNQVEVSKVMHPIRDIPYFLEITQKLGRDWQKTPVSCPMSFGWGGAMGPAQFIPSTWVKYESRVAEILGKSVADPWSIKDSFLAAGLLLADLGASNKTYESEWKAAMLYFSGTVNSKYQFYGNSVMQLAQSFQADIQVLEGNSLGYIF